MDEYLVEKKSSGEKFLDVLVFVAVFLVTIFLILELLGRGLNISGNAELYLWISVFVFVVFIIDLIRLGRHSKGFGDFMSNNWLDVLATIPFELIALGLGHVDPQTLQAFGVLKWSRFHKLSKLGKLQQMSRVSKVSKEFKAAAHLKREGERYKKHNKL